MPRRKNQGQNVNNVGTDSTENMAANSDVELKWRDTTLCELQSMFSGSVDAEVVHLVLSESNYNVNDAIENLFILSGIEQEKKQDKSSSDHKMSSSLSLSSTAGTHDQPQLPRTVPYSSTLPLSPVYHESTSPTILSSGLPDFPDSISQQYNALKSQAKVPANFEGFSHKEPSKHNTNARPPLSQQVVSSSSEFSKTAAMKQQGPEHEAKGNTESFLKEMISHNSSSDDWEKVSRNNTEQQRLDWEPSKKKMNTGSVNSGTSVTHARMSSNKGQMPYKERTSNSNATFIKSQNPMLSNPSQNIHKSLPSHEANKPHFQHTVNNAQQLPNHGAFNSLSKESMFRPPAAQRQVQPFVPHPQFGQTIQGNASQARFGFAPAVPSPWQQVLQRPLPPGQIPYQYPQGTNPYQPPFFLGRAAQPSAAIRPTGQASAVRIPFFPTIHQKLLILIRGLPGSGKTTLAQKLKGTQGVVLSTDDYFFRNQRYKFDATLLGEAHEWNQNRAKSALEKLFSPVIIDNTNTQTWEMKPYVSMALRHGYYIKFIEPDTTWKWNVRELARRNQHGVGVEAITRMKERFEQNVSVEKIMNCEKNPDANENGNGSRKEETRKETGASIQNPIPRPRFSPHERGSRDLGTSERQNHDRTTSRENPASNETNSSKGVKSENNVKARENEFLEESKNKANTVEKSDSSGRSENEGKFASEIDIGASDNSADDGYKDENQEISCPKPQRVSRVREKRSPNNQQCGDVDDNAKKADIGASGNSADDGSKDDKEASSSPKPQRVPRVGEKRSPNNQKCNDADDSAKSDISAPENPAGDGSKEDHASSSPKPQREPRVREKRSPNNQRCNDAYDNAKSDISTPENPADEGKEENHGSSSPMPQRVRRVREKTSPNNQLRSDAELTALVCEEEFSVKQQENLIYRVNNDELELRSKATQGSDPEEDSAVYVEDLELSKDASLVNWSFFSPPFFKSRNGEVIEEDTVAAELSMSLSSCVDAPPLWGTPSELCSAQMWDGSSVESEKSDRMTDQHTLKAKTKELTEEASNKGQITRDLESPDKIISLSLGRYVDHDVTGSRDVVRKQHEPSRNKSISTPPSLSSILASASRSKQKKRPSFNSDHKQLIASEGNSSLEKDANQPVEARDRRVELSELHVAQVVCDGSTQENKNSVKDVSSDVQNLSDELQQATSGDSANDIPAGVEFLKTCFPDLDSDVVNALLTANNGDVTKVVDELLATQSDLPSFPARGSEVIEQQSIASGLPTFPDSHILASQVPSFNSLTKNLKSHKPTDESHVIGDSATREHGEIPGGMTTRTDRANQPRALGPRHMARAQSPIHKTFQLTLEPAVALHLIEMFGPFNGVNFQEDISHEDLIIDVDNLLARQLYKKWEKSVQTRKGISAAKRGSSPRANRQLADSDSRMFSGDQTFSDKPRPSQHLPTGPQAGNLREIMDEELALALSRKTNVADVNEQDIATKQRQTLYEMFPGVDPVALAEVFQANRYELAPSVEAVKASCNLSGREIPSTVITSGFKNQEETIRKEPREEDWSWLYADDSSQSETNEGSFQTLEAPSYLDYRAEAFQHYKLRDECFKKAALAFSSKQGELAKFYAQQGHMHTEKIKEANARAAALILNQTNESTDENTIDLHGLHVTEAIEAVQKMLSEKTGCKEIFVITGRGNNSRGGKARIKPAILEYLKKNNYRHTEPHPGLVKVFL